jgi:hypothetical protein
MELKKCVLCDFDKYVNLHHIIKVTEFGSHDSSNTCYLCPNHHWIADFGTDEDQEEIRRLIFEKTGKKGSRVDDEIINIVDFKIRVLQEEIWGSDVWDDVFWLKFKETSNYETEKCFLLGRGCPQNISNEINDKADKLIQIRKLKMSMNKYKFT